jgi:hypothetical protein
VIRMRSCFQAVAVGTCLSRSTAEHSTKPVMLSGSLTLYRTGYGTPRRRWRLAQELMSRSCRGYWDIATAAMTLDRYGHLLSDDLAGVADVLGKAIEITAASLRYSEPEYDEMETISAAS